MSAVNAKLATVDQGALVHRLQASRRYKGQRERESREEWAVTRIAPLVHILHRKKKEAKRSERQAEEEELGGSCEADSKRFLSVKAKRHYAIKRLHTDLQEVLAHPLPTVSASPVDESNMFIWHGNLMGVEGTPYHGVVFHVVLTFPQTYPYNPPRVDLCTYLKHDSVFGQWICLDMLEDDWCPSGRWMKNGRELKKWVPGAAYRSDQKNDVGTGWSSGYSVQSILVQLQAFLMDGGATSRTTESDIKNSRKSAATLRCSCGHCPGKAWPPFRSSADVDRASVRQHREQMQALTAQTNVMKRAHGTGSSGYSCADEETLRQATVTSTLPIDCAPAGAAISELDSCGKCGGGLQGWCWTTKCSRCPRRFHSYCAKEAKGKRWSQGWVCDFCRSCFSGDGPRSRQTAQWAERLVDGAECAAPVTACTPLHQPKTKATETKTRAKTKTKRAAPREEQKGKAAKTGSKTSEHTPVPSYQCGDKICRATIIGVDAEGARLAVTPAAPASTSTSILLPAREMKRVEWNEDKSDIVGMVQDRKLVVGYVFDEVFVTKVVEVTKALLVSQTLPRPQRQRNQRSQRKPPLRSRARLSKEAEAALAPGTQLDGVVVRVKDFGAFVDVGWSHGHGLVHCTEVTRNRKDGCSRQRLGRAEMEGAGLTVGADVAVWVKGVDVGGKHKLALTMLEELPEPAPCTLAELASNRDVLLGVIRRIDNDLGAFIDVGIQLQQLQVEAEAVADKMPEEDGQCSGSSESSLDIAIDTAIDESTGSTTIGQCAQCRATVVLSDHVDVSCPQLKFCDSCWVAHDQTHPSTGAGDAAGVAVSPPPRKKQHKDCLALCRVENVRQSLLRQGLPFFWQLRGVLQEGQRVWVRVRRVDVDRKRAEVELVLVPHIDIDANVVDVTATPAPAPAPIASAHEQDLKREYEWRSCSPFASMCDHLLCHVQSFLVGGDGDGDRASSVATQSDGDPGAALRDAFAFASSCHLFRRLAGGSTTAAMARAELVCYHSKVPFCEDTLGIGINLEHYPGGGSKTDPNWRGKEPKPATLAYVHASLDLLSYGAFYHERVRQNVWKQPFAYWLPLYLCKKHARRAIPEAKECIAMMCTPEWAHDEKLVEKRRAAREGKCSRYGRSFRWDGSLSGAGMRKHERCVEKKMAREAGQRGALRFKPEMVLEVLPKLMNTMVVSISNGGMHASMVALEGYMACYHLLLAFLELYPELQTQIEEKWDRFLDGEQGRNKRAVPSLGDMLCLLAASDKHSWATVASSVVTELFDRNAKWVLERDPLLADICKELRRGQLECANRLSKSFKSAKVSIKIVMFHVAFLGLFRPSSKSTVISPEGYKEVLVRPRTVRETKAELDSCYGRPTHLLQQAMQARCKAIAKTTNWDHFFAGVALPAPSAIFLSQWLRTAVLNSGRRRYHDQHGMSAHLKWVENSTNAKRRGRREAKQARIADGIADSELDNYEDESATIEQASRMRGWY